MAKERYIDADKLIELIYSKCSYVNVTGSNYGAGTIESIIDAKINQSIQQAIVGFATNLAMAINDSATLDGPCMLCRTRDCDTVPIHPLDGRDSL